jgi:cytochrome d ubiquinol oxidase subunit I
VTGAILLGAVALAALLWLLARVRRREPGRWLLRALVVLGPAGFLALEAGWLVTEWGRQPFTIQGVMRTADAVTPVSSLAVPFVAFAALYLLLGAMVGILLWRQIRRSAPPAAPAGAGGAA